ncbi:cilia- and flagella-associated protein 418 [Diretmus argenteus]
MDDDLDELLDEVEHKFCRNVSVASSAHTDSSKAAKSGKENEGERTYSATKPEQLISDTEDIDALLAELDEDFNESHQSKTEQLPTGLKTEKKPSVNPGGRRCCPVFLGGSSIATGIGTAMSKRSCDQLRCTSCDFRVLTFDDYEWDTSCDYLFLRNNMPDSQKLRSRLKRRRGLRSYACQCSWFSARETTDLRDQSQLRWVCGKHQD